jgi:glutamine amidotransferase
MIGIIDHGAGNIRSVTNALDDLRAAWFVGSTPEMFAGATKVILPGVGAASDAMGALRAAGMDRWIRECQLPLLGICLGMQLLFQSTAEHDTTCLGLIPGAVRRFGAPALRVPHMGWNRVHAEPADPLFNGITSGEHFYFVHSYYATPGIGTIATATYGTPIAAAVRAGRVCGVQFHPEKSGPVGLRLLRNFVES